MRKPTTIWQHPGWLLATSVFLASCGDDTDRYELLDRLRVLAIRAESPDLVVGETATLSASVFEPEGREVSYEWSWCPWRGDGDAAFECYVPEAALQRAWTAAELDGEPPTYDLGVEREAELTHVLSPELMAALCQAPDVEERVKAACFEGLEASIQLTVRSAGAELTAVKVVPLLMDEGAERNLNPPSHFALSVLDQADGTVVEDTAPLRAGHRYAITADVDEGTAELFTPEAREGEPPPTERRETMVMTWFVTVGELDDPEDDDGEFVDDFVRTTFVDGSNMFEDLLRNGWKLPLTAGSTAELHVMLRDERGGVGWTMRRFDVVGGEP